MWPTQRFLGCLLTLHRKQLAQLVRWDGAVYFTHVRSWHLLSSCFQPIFASMPQQLKPQPYPTGWERKGPVDKTKLQPKDDPSSPWRPYSFNAQKSRGASAAARFWWFSFLKDQQSWIFSSLMEQKDSASGTDQLTWQMQLEETVS